MLASTPADSMNHIPGALGIPYQFNFNAFRSNPFEDVDGRAKPGHDWNCRTYA